VDEDATDALTFVVLQEQVNFALGHVAVPDEKRRGAKAGRRVSETGAKLGEALRGRLRQSASGSEQT
jgi:hypothetical protein